MSPFQQMIEIQDVLPKYKTFLTYYQFSTEHPLSAVLKTVLNFLNRLIRLYLNFDKSQEKNNLFLTFF